MPSSERHRGLISQAYVIQPLLPYLSLHNLHDQRQLLLEDYYTSLYYSNTQEAQTQSKAPLHKAATHWKERAPVGVINNTLDTRSEKQRLNLHSS